MSSLEKNLQVMERYREAYWLRHPNTAALKLHWRATTVRHSFHVLPGQSILEIGAGTGLWTRHLTAVLDGQCPITAAAFNDDFMQAAPALANVNFVKINSLEDLPAESFDYVVGTAILSHDLYPQNLAAIYRLLKPGGQLLFFEANYWNFQVFLKQNVSAIRRFTGIAPCQIGMRHFQLMKIASAQGFTHIDITPYDIIHPQTPIALVRTLQYLAFVLERAPLIRELCGTLYILAKKPGGPNMPQLVNLAIHEQLHKSVSVVVPCYNEEMTIQSLVDALLQAYDPYIHEIVLVNDNSKDRTAEVALELAKTESRIKLVNRTPPGGVGRALRDGYAAATGRYILSMDCDFKQIVPELRDMFDAVAEGHDGAIGSRFSYDSVLINYPFTKIICNRMFHLLVNILLPVHVRDISNNLKIYRTEILKKLIIEQDGFAANVETGLKPILDGYDVKEVSISWINRTIDMGTSSFRIANVAPNYFLELVSIVRGAWSTRPKCVDKPRK
ncbi:MAG: bifunctional class I SAM-dependent methyltransferase/glycosyltransferase family 2 protein [Candidatus Obscuribacterales bacterium]|nr:bifunctional class I SAM-dependent methyltransferase/glycosyltransferase family 2 protein [Candidatus Obscuribacterales bacterium]